MTQHPSSPEKFFSFILISLLFLTACGSQKSQNHQRSQFLMGTLVEISVSGIDKESAYSSIQLAFQEIRRLENLMSTHIPTSEVSKINQAAGKTFVPVSQEVLEVIQRSLFWSEQTKGAFDITIGPAQELWNFDEPSLPSNAAIADAAKLIDYRNIQIQKNTVLLSGKGMLLHLGAIGKGYAVDRAIKILKNNKVKNALINAGGDLITLGKRSNNLSWKIGLQHPRNPESLLASFSTSKKAIATSGDYQKYFELGGKRYHHILDPKTGHPSNGTMSATVIANNVMDADALATAVFVLGPEKGIVLLDSLNDMEGLIVDINGKVNSSKNINSIENFTLSANNVGH